MKTSNFSHVYDLIILSSIFILGCSDKLDDSLDLKKDTAIVDIQVVANSILIDASHDGGVWWFPQSESGGFSSDLDHQGKALADYLTKQGFIVTELPRGTTITTQILSNYYKVIRAGKFGTYTASELQAYKDYIEKGSSLILISEFLRQGSRDELADQLGIQLVGMAKADLEIFAEHPITENVKPFCYNAGSVMLNPDENKNIEVLGWLPEGTIVQYSNGKTSTNSGSVRGIAAMGVLHHPKSKIFFIGDINGLQRMPQPFIDNLFKWAFE